MPQTALEVVESASGQRTDKRMTLPVELFLAFTLVAVACEQCGADVQDGERVCPECAEARRGAWAPGGEPPDDV